MKRDRLLAGAIGSLLIVAYALLWVSKWDWETLPRLVKRSYSDDEVGRVDERDRGVGL